MAGHGCQGQGGVFPADGTGRSAGVLLPGVVVTQALNLLPKFVPSALQRSSIRSVGLATGVGGASYINAPGDLPVKYEDLT